MGGMTLAKTVEAELKRQGISKGDFYNAVGISATAMYGWKRGAEPKKETIKSIEKYLNISLSDIEKSDRSSETDEVLQWLREDFSHRALFESAKGLTKEQAYAAASFIEKLKAGET